MTTQIRNSEYGLVPTGAILDPDVSNSSLRLLALLSTYADGHGYCWPSLTTLAQQAGVSKQAISKTLHRLEKAGWLRIIERKRKNGSQTTNGYYIQRHKHGIVPEPPEELPDVVDGGSGQTGSEESGDQSRKRFTGGKPLEVDPRTYHMEHTTNSSSKDFTNVKSFSEQLSSFPTLTVQDKATVLRESYSTLSRKAIVGYVTNLLLGMPDAPKPNARKFVEAAGGMKPLYKFVAYVITQFPLDFLVDWLPSLKAVPWKPGVDWKKYLFGAALREYRLWWPEKEKQQAQMEAKDEPSLAEIVGEDAFQEALERMTG